MAISPNTFNALKRFVSVRLQQGVPLVDADWNEMEDIRKFELRAFLKWFVGDGIPEGVDDSFKIVVDDGGMVNDFRILAGGRQDGLKAGRCLVDGLDVFITEDTTFQTQPAIIENLTVRVPTLPPLTIPPIPGARGSKVEALVYLDVWERLITPDEDESLKHDSVRKVESCVRIKREWVVRVRIDKDNDLPKPRDTDYRSDHSYYKLALINIVSLGDDVGRFDAKTVIDLREKKLLIPPATLIEDTLGIAPTDYRKGKGRPKIDLREAINVLLRGELPGTPEQKLTEDGSSFASGTAIHNQPVLKDQNGNIWLFYYGDQSNFIYSQYNSKNGIWKSKEIPEITSVRNIYSLEDDRGNICIVWEDYSHTIWLKCHNPNSESWEASQKLISEVNDINSWFILEDHNGIIWIFWSTKNKKNISFKKYIPNNNVLEPEKPIANSNETEYLFAVEFSNSSLWVFWTTPISSSGESRNILYTQLDLNTGNPSAKAKITDDLSLNSNPFAIKSLDGDIWLFWNSNRLNKTDIWGKQFNQRISKWEDELLLTQDSPENCFAPIVLESSGSIMWLFWISSSDYSIWCKRYINKKWEESFQFSHSGSDDYDFSSYPLHFDGDIWVFWPRYVNSVLKYSIWLRKLIFRI